MPRLSKPNSTVQENCNTPRYRTPQAIPIANYERNPFIACWERLQMRCVPVRCVETTLETGEPYHSNNTHTTVNRLFFRFQRPNWPVTIPNSMGRKILGLLVLNGKMTKKKNIKRPRYHVLDPEFIVPCYPPFIGIETLMYKTSSHHHPQYKRQNGKSKKKSSIQDPQNHPKTQLPKKDNLVTPNIIIIPNQTLKKTNMSPENQWLKNVFPIEISSLFRGRIR